MEDDEFRDYSNSWIKLLGIMEVELASNDWKKRAEVRVIGGMGPSIVGRDLMGKLGLHLMQTNPRGALMNIQGTKDSTGEKQQAGESEEEQIDPLQQYFS